VLDGAGLGRRSSGLSKVALFCGVTATGFATGSSQLGIGRRFGWRSSQQGRAVLPHSSAGCRQVVEPFTAGDARSWRRQGPGDQWAGAWANRRSKSTVCLFRAWCDRQLLEDAAAGRYRFQHHGEFAVNCLTPHQARCCSCARAAPRQGNQLSRLSGQSSARQGAVMPGGAAEGHRRAGLGPLASQSSPSAHGGLLGQHHRPIGRQQQVRARGRVSSLGAPLAGRL